MIRIRSVSLVVLVILAAIAGGVTGPWVGTRIPTAWAATDNEPFVLYYTVRDTYRGKPEDLWSIADRYLGDEDRAGEIFDLNSTRIQPDGGRLADPSRLTAGWHLILPWDAIGKEIHYGVLPSAAPAPTPAGSPETTGPPRSPGVPGGAGASPTPPAGSPRPSGASGCAAATPAPSRASTWGQEALAPDQVWQRATGVGVGVAVVDSGVDGTRPELAARVSAGADIITGSGRGDMDCLGTGTALAGVVAGDDRSSGKRFGVAPGATIVPIRLVSRAATASASDAATAIQVAISTRAPVILLGSFVDVSDPTVRGAIDNAIAHDVVVVMPAQAAVADGAAVAGSSAGLLRVGAVTKDRKLAVDYPSGAVDLVAPGRDIASIGGGDVVTRNAPYAAAFVAGTVALVRSIHTDLAAGAVTAHVLRTTTPWEEPDRFGAGMVSPTAAVATLVTSARTASTGAEPSGGTSAETLVIIALWAIVGVACPVALLLWLRRRRTGPLQRSLDGDGPGSMPTA